MTPLEATMATLSSIERDVEIVFFGERESHWRRARLDALTASFPQARCHGSGWPAGRLDDAELHALYRRARIGWNVHNSTGPINRRLYALAAFGVLQICDNKTGLAEVFRLGEEALGFDTIPEVIEQPAVFDLFLRGFAPGGARVRCRATGSLGRVRAHASGADRR